MFTVKGMAELNKNLERFSAKVIDEIDEAVLAAALSIEKETMLTIREPSMGTYVKRYTASGKPYDHIAAKEGESPNTDTGLLIRSLSTDHKKGQGMAYVGTNLEYGFFLETVQNRPFLKPSMAKKNKGFEKNIQKAIKEQIKKTKVKK